MSSIQARISRLAESVALSVLVLLVTFAVAASAYAEPRPFPKCESPRAAVRAVFEWQNELPTSLSNAARCFERDGRSPKELRVLAERVKAVYDTEGAFIELADLSDEVDYVDPESGRHAATANDDLPEGIVIKSGNRWIWPKSSLDALGARYRDRLSWVDRSVDRLPGVFRVTLLGLALWQLLALCGLLLAGVLVRRALVALVGRRVAKWSRGLKVKWPSKLVDLIASPLATFVTAVVLRLGYPHLHLPVEVAAGTAIAVRVLISMSLLWAAYRAVDLGAAYVAERAERTESKLDDQLVPLLRKLLKGVVVVLGILIILQHLRFNVTTLLTSVSIGTLAVGLAAKDTLANLFGSISIFVDNPFQIGDWIEVDSIHGTVEEVGFRSTRIRTFSSSLVVIPNAKIANATINNHGQRHFRRCVFNVGLEYDTPPDRVQAFVEGCRAVVAAEECTRQDRTEIHLTALGAHSLDVQLYFFFECDTWSQELSARHRVLLNLLRLAEALGVGLAFPTQTLHVVRDGSSVGAEGTGQGATETREELARLVASFGPGGHNANAPSLLVEPTSAD